MGTLGFDAVLKRVRVSNERYYRTRYHASEVLKRLRKPEAVSEFEVALPEEYKPIVRREIKQTITFLKSKKDKNF